MEANWDRDEQDTRCKDILSAYESKYDIDELMLIVDNKAITHIKYHEILNTLILLTEMEDGKFIATRTHNATTEQMSKVADYLKLEYG